MSCNTHCLHRHFDYPRAGGRASQRATDFVRRRLWRRKAQLADHMAALPRQEALPSDGQSADTLISPATVMFSTKCAFASVVSCHVMSRLTKLWHVYAGFPQSAWHGASWGCPDVVVQCSCAALSQCKVRLTRISVRVLKNSQLRSSHCAA